MPRKACLGHTVLLAAGKTTLQETAFAKLGLSFSKQCYLPLNTMKSSLLFVNCQPKGNPRGPDTM